MYLDTTGYLKTGNTIADGDNWNYQEDEGSCCETCGCYTNDITTYQGEELCQDCANDAKKEEEAEKLAEEVENELKERGEWLF